MMRLGSLILVAIAVASGLSAGSAYAGQDAPPASSSLRFAARRTWR